MTIPRILVVEDDPDMSAMLTEFLQKNGFIALSVATEAALVSHLSAGRIDLILLDVMLGDENGVHICERLRAEQSVPIIMVSALSADHQRMAGYQVGADDYIAKPFNPELLLARIEAVLRRTRRSPSLIYRRNIKTYHFGGWVYDGKHDEVRSPEGFQVALSRRETGLLKVLLANPHVPLTREEIATAMDVTGDGQGSVQNPGRAVDMLVGRLRSKIENSPKEPEILRTERGVGYVLAVDVTGESAPDAVV